MLGFCEHDIDESVCTVTINLYDFLASISTSASQKWVWSKKILSHSKESEKHVKEEIGHLIYWTLICTDRNHNYYSAIPNSLTLKFTTTRATFLSLLCLPRFPLGKTPNTVDTSAFDFHSGSQLLADWRLSHNYSALLRNGLQKWRLLRLPRSCSLSILLWRMLLHREPQAFPSVCSVCGCRGCVSWRSAPVNLEKNVLPEDPLGARCVLLFCSSPFVRLQPQYEAGWGFSPSRRVQLQQLDVDSVFLFTEHSLCRWPPPHHKHGGRCLQLSLTWPKF